VTPPPQTGWRANPGLKLLSLLMAFSLWLYVNARGQVQINFAVPVVPTDLPAELVLTDLGAESAEVRVQALPADLERIQPRHVEMRLDLSEAVPGEQWLPISVDDVVGAGTAEVVHVEPRQVRVVIERRVTRPFTVEPVINGEPDAARKVQRVTVDPAEVQLTGGESAFKRFKHLTTQPVDITGLAHSLRREVRLDLQGRDLQMAVKQPVYVTITLVDNPPATPPSGAAAP